MSDQAISAGGRAWVSGVRDATPLLGGYIPVAISFGLIANQAGFSSWEAIIISLVIYAGASQFLFVGMVASGAPLWLVVVMTLLINARHLVYAPNLAPWLTGNRWWFWLMHGLTDQVFALAHTRLPALPPPRRSRRGSPLRVRSAARTRTRRPGRPGRARGKPRRASAPGPAVPRK